jgi:hypothetical protein
MVAFGYQLDNGVPISSYIEGTKDQELLFLRAYLEQLFPHPDFRALNRKMFKLRNYLETLA